MIVDTGALFAIYNTRDRHHKGAASVLRQALKDRERLWVPSPVLAELHWLARRLQRREEFIARVLGDIADGAWDLVDLSPADARRIGVLLMQYQDARLDFVDAACIALAERLGETTIATVDRRDFSIVRPAHVPALRLLPD